MTMSLERTGSVDSGSSWGDEYDGGIVNPAGNSYPSQEPVDEITVERMADRNEDLPSTFTNQDISFEYNASWCCLKILYKTAYKIRKLWGTCQSEDTKNNKDITIRLTLRELVIYVVFLIILCFVGFGMTSSATYYFTNSISTTFIDVPISTNDVSLTFKNLRNSHHWYQFALGPLLDGLYSKTKFGFNFTSGDLNLFLRDKFLKKSDDNKSLNHHLLLENQLYGLPRLRLLKVRNDSCSVHRDFQPYVNYCFGPYSIQTEDTKKFGPLNSTAWFYQTADQLESSSNNYPGKLSSYGGGGFVQDLNTTYYWSRLAIEQLWRFDWLVPGATRAVFIDFTLYNPNVNLFCIIRLLTEFPSSGGVVTSWNFRTVKLLRYTTTMDYVILGFECILVAFLIYFSIEEAIEIHRLGLKYFKSFFNVNDVIIVIFLFSVMVLNIHRTIEVDRTFFSSGNAKNDPGNIDLNKNDPTQNDTAPSFGLINNQTILVNKYVDLDKMGELQSTMDTMIAILLFFSWLKPFEEVNNALHGSGIRISNVILALLGIDNYLTKLHTQFMELQPSLGSLGHELSEHFQGQKLFKFIGFNRTLSQLSLTMGSCFADILAFTFIFILVYLSFAQLGYFLFGSVLQDFSTMGGTMFAQFRILLGDYKLDNLVLANNVLGPAYFMLLVFVLLFILANMFLAIINDAYSDVKIELSRKKSDLELMDYIKRGYQKLLHKLSWRRDCHNIEITGGSIERKRSFCAVDETRGGRLKNSKSRKDCQRKKPCDSFDDSDEDSSIYGERVAQTGVKGLPRSLGRVRNDITTKGSRGVSHEEFSLLQRRVDRMEHSIGSVVSKIDAILVKLEGLERLRTNRKDQMTRLLDSVTESEGMPEECRQGREENEAWDAYSGVSGVDPSPTSSNSIGRVMHSRDHVCSNVGMESSGTSLT